MDQQERELERRWRESGAEADEQALLWAQHRRGVPVDLAAHLGYGPARAALGLPLDRPPTTPQSAHSWAAELEQWGPPVAFRALLGWIELALAGIRIENSWFGEQALEQVAGLLHDPTPERRALASAELPNLIEARAIYENNAHQDVFAGNFSIAGVAEIDVERLTGVARLSGAAAIQLLGACLGAAHDLPQLCQTAWSNVGLAQHPELWNGWGSRSFTTLRAAPRRALLAEILAEARAKIVPWALGRGDPLAARFPATLRAYRPTGSYQVGERLHHSKFGRGEVLSVRAGQAEIRFESSTRTLRCAR